MSNPYPRITVVTPNFNQVQFIETTILSVLDQNYPNLEYIIIDGGSNDGSVEIIKKYQKNLHYWESIEDNGMYDALMKGFSRSTGEIMCWINSDDVLWKDSLKNVKKILEENSHIHWLQGWPTVIDEKGKIYLQRSPVFSKFYFYLKNHKNSGFFIQQESTFWTRDIWERSGSYLNLDYKLAADFDLWMRFFKLEKLYCTNIPLGAFRIRKGQLSSNKKLYLQEANRSIQTNFETLRIWDFFRIKFMWYLQWLKKNTGLKLIKRLYGILQGKLIGQPIMVVVEKD